MGSTSTLAGQLGPSSLLRSNVGKTLLELCGVYKVTLRICFHVFGPITFFTMSGATRSDPFAPGARSSMWLRSCPAHVDLPGLGPESRRTPVSAKVFRFYLVLLAGDASTGPRA